MEKTETSELEHSFTQNDGSIRYTCSYLPHHGVIKETSKSTRLRVVFDASHRTSSGYSLNDSLMIGPTIQDILVCYS